MPPHRPQPEEQQSREPCYDVQVGSRHTPQVEFDTIRMVERLYTEPTTVYDLQVEDAGCFFAEEVLVGNCFIIDDPVKDAEEADSETQREKVWDWWDSTAETRLAPGAGVLGIQCMTGETPVLLPDGTDKRLDEIQVGDKIATYDDGKLVESIVLDHRSNGRDFCFKITMSSGRIVTANERHPFLVEDDEGDCGWTRLKNLRLGQKIVTVRDNGVSGKGRHARKKDVTSRLAAEDFVLHTTESGSDRRATGRRPRRINDLLPAPSSNIGTGLPSTITRGNSRSKMVSALFAGYRLKPSTTQTTGERRCVSTTTTKQAKQGGCFATTATSLSSAATRSRFSSPQLDTSDFTTDRVASIEPVGEREVFDVQVERTENFIANTLVSHNTRWNDDDLSGRFLRQMNEAVKEVQEERESLQQQRLSKEIDDISYRRETSRLDRYEEEITRWEVLTFPALATEDEWLEVDTLRVCYEPEVREALGDDTYDDIVAYRQNEVFGKRTSNRTELAEGGFKLLRVKDEALHPTRFDELHFRKKKRGSQPRFWSAMYQQNPVPEEGVYFTKGDFRFEPVVADYRLMRVYAAFDMAIGQKQTNDWTVGLIGGHDYDDRLHILNMIRVRTDKLAELIMDSVTPYKDVLASLGLEQGQIQMAVMPSLQREMERRRIYLPMDDSLRPITDKLARARPAQAWMQQGRIILPSNQPWIEQFQMELLRFPGGLHDDIIDALAWLVRMVMNNKPPKKPVKRGQPKSWKDKLNGMTNNGRGKGALVA